MKCSGLLLFALRPKSIDRLDSMTQVWYDDTSAHNERNIKGIEQFVVLPAALDALDEMVVNAIVAPKDGGRYESEKFLGLPIECAVFVCSRVEIEETFDSQVIDLTDAIVHPRPVRSELIELR